MKAVWLYLTILLDVYPFIFLQFYPLKNDLKYSYKKTMLISFLILNVYFIFFAITALATNYNFAVMFAIRCIMLIVMGALTFVFCKKSMAKVAFMFSLMAPYVVFTIVGGSFFKQFLHSENWPLFMASSLCRLLIIILTYPVIFYLVKKYFPDNLLPDESVWENAVRIGFIFTALSFTFLKTDFERQNVPLYNLLGSALLLISCISVFIFVLKMLYQVNEKATLAERQREILDIITMQKQQFKIITKHIEETRAMRHDLRHHLSAITGLALNNQFDELKEYLSKYEKIVHISEEFYFCSNNTINSVVTYYLTLAKEENIKVDYKFQLDMLGGLSDVDLCVVLGNCLENAITAAAMLPLNQRRIKVRAKCMCGNISVIIDNSYDGIVFKENNAFLSRKQQTPVAGVGLASVQRTVDKMNGMMKIEYTDTTFMVSILLPTEGTLNSSVN